MFCCHHYEMVSQKTTCEELVVLSRCTKCGKVSIKKEKINNHEFVEVSTGNITLGNGNVYCHIYVLRCKKCGEMKDVRVGI